MIEQKKRESSYESSRMLLNRSNTASIATICGKYEDTFEQRQQHSGNTDRVPYDYAELGAYKIINYYLFRASANRLSRYNSAKLLLNRNQIIDAASENFSRERQQFTRTNFLFVIIYNEAV